MRIIAVDFDGTMCRSKWPEIGEANDYIINALIGCQKDGAKLILWTCREGDELEAAVAWCSEHGVQFDAINDNLEENKKYFGNNSRKVYATEYWDDKSVIVYADNRYSTTVKNRPGGGYEQHQWLRTEVQIKQKAGLADRLKAWWKKWRCE